MSTTSGSELGVKDFIRAQLHDHTSLSSAYGALETIPLEALWQLLLFLLDLQKTKTVENPLLLHHEGVVHHGNYVEALSLISQAQQRRSSSLGARPARPRSDQVGGTIVGN
jgi:hypothetical protein